MNAYFNAKGVPAIADVRAMGKGDTIWIWDEGAARKDIARYAEAIGVAVLRGVHVRQMSR